MPGAIIEVGGMAALSFGAHGAAALAWAPPAAVCGAGLWTPTPPCGEAPWQPIGACNSGTWTKQRLPEMETV